MLCQVAGQFERTESPDIRTFKSDVVPLVPRKTRRIVQYANDTSALIEVLPLLVDHNNPGTYLKPGFDFRLLKKDAHNSSFSDGS